MSVIYCSDFEQFYYVIFQINLASSEVDSTAWSEVCAKLAGLAIISYAQFETSFGTLVETPFQTQILSELYM